MTRLRPTPIFSVILAFGSYFVAIIDPNAVAGVLALGLSAITLAILTMADNGS